MGRARANHEWTDEERDIIRRDYTHTRQSRRELAYRLNVTEFGVAGQIAIMGISKRDDRRRWTTEEEERLAELIHRYCPRRIAKIMNRSITSIVVKAGRLSISRRIRDGWFTKSEVCEIFGVDHHWIQRRIDSSAIIASYHFDHRPSKNGGSMWHIEAKDLKAFIRRYPDELTGRNVDLPMIVELLAGITNGNNGESTSRLI